MRLSNDAGVLMRIADSHGADDNKVHGRLVDEASGTHSGGVIRQISAAVHEFDAGRGRQTNRNLQHITARQTMEKPPKDSTRASMQAYH